MIWSSLGELTPDRQGCYEGIPSPQTLLWIDVTSLRLSEPQMLALRRAIDDVYGGLGFNERLSIITTEADTFSSVPKPRVHVCGQARSPEELEAAGASAAMPGYLERKRHELYERVLGPELDAILSPQALEARAGMMHSPILEQIAYLSRSLTAGDRLVLATDGVQNSEAAKFCQVRGDMPSFSSFAKRDLYRQLLKPQRMDGVRVTWLMVQLPSYGAYCSGEGEVRRFFEDYFTGNGASMLDVIRIRFGKAG